MAELLDHDGVFDGIVDLYVGNHCDFDDLQAHGVAAVIHRASLGVEPDHLALEHPKPDRYHPRRKALRLSQEAIALETGFHRTFIGGGGPVSERPRHASAPLRH